LPDPRTLTRLEWEIGAAASSGRLIGFAELDGMLDQAGTMSGADLLWRAVVSGVVSGDVLARVLGNVFRFSYPNGPGKASWIHMFRMAGYTQMTPDACKPAERPHGPLRLYRGAPEGRRHGLSWTPSPQAAARFTKAWGGPGVIWEADIPPDRLLCCCRTAYIIEYVVDAEGLDVRKAST
jgi:hypothetical protein